MRRTDQEFRTIKHCHLIIAVVLVASLLVTGCGGKTGTSLVPDDTTGGDDSFSESPVANSVRVVEVTGEVAFQRPGEKQDWIPAVSGMQLALADILTTQIASETDLDVDQDKHVLVGEQVRMIIETLLQTIDHSKVARLRVDTGALYIRIQRKLATDEAFEVITPTCVMGVRGTEFVVATRGGDTQVFVIEGTLRVALNPKDLDKNKGRAYGDTLPDAAWISISSGQMLEIPWGSTAIEQLLPIPLDFSKMPLDMLKALSVSDSDKLTPHMSAIEDAEQAQLAHMATIGINSMVAFLDVPTLSERPYVDPTSGHVYARIDSDLSFKAATAYCMDRGGYLMTITSEEEQALAEAILIHGNKFWYLFGLVQKSGSIEPNQGFEWVTGELVEFTRWHQTNGVESEPSDVSALGNHENQVVMLNYAGDSSWKLGDWNDTNLDEEIGGYGFLCEWDSTDHFYGLEVDIK